MRDLNVVLQSDYGINLSGWYLQEATQISADGTAICGNAYHNGVQEGWVFRLQSVTPTPTSVVSRKTHGTAGAFDINLPLTGSAGVECRRGGVNGDHQVVFTFASAVTLSGATVTPEAGMSGSMAGAPSLSPDGRTVTLSLTNVTNAQTVAITLSGVSNGTSTNDVAVPMSLLVGDTNADRAVNSGDALQTRSRSGGATDSTNFRSDVNTDGAVNSGDTSIVRARSGNFLP
jgi:hypothetical protein